MDGDLVNILLWHKPIKSLIFLFTLNLCLWFLIHQRPLCVFSLLSLSIFLKNLWKERIRPEILVDPPDHESWVTLSTYDFTHALSSFLTRLWNYYSGLRDSNHVLFSLISFVIFGVLLKISSSFNLITLLFIFSNFSFALGPLLKFLPIIEPTWLFPNPDEDLVPDVSSAEPLLWSPTPSPKERSVEGSEFSRESSAEPHSFTPSISRMPGIEGDSEEEFHFDSAHFDSSSSASSTSNSFELINI